MKSTRNIKLRSYCPEPGDLYKGKNHNPLGVKVATTPSHAETQRYLNAYKIAVNVMNVPNDQ
jgi:proteasome activator subunit 4